MSPVRMSKIEAAIRMVLEFNTAFNNHDVDGMMVLMSDDCVFDNTYPSPDGTLYQGKEAVARFWEEFFQESPSARIEIEDIYGLGKRCIMRWRYEWVDANGDVGHVRGVDLYQVDDQGIREKLSYVKG